ncbi:MAG: ABC transporter permease, partial [Deltaproteobacteria bacterium]
MEAPLRRLLALARPELKTLAVATFFLVIGSGTTLVYPQAIRWIIDGVLAGGRIEDLDRIALLMVGIFLVQSVAVALRSYLFTVAGERIVTRLRRDLFSRIMIQDIAFFDG